MEWCSTVDAFLSNLQIAFRARIGKKYQLPHKGIIPEEFGVVSDSSDF